MSESKIHAALNEHVSLELRAWYQYSAMALWLDLNDLPGCASFMKSQADEEMAHANRMIRHLVDRDVLPQLPPIDAPPAEYGSVKEVFELVLEAEREVTASIDVLYRLADEEDDQPARIMLEWFISEQMEEENLARAILGRIRLAGDTGPGLLLVDQELGSGGVPGAMQPSE